MKSRPEYNLKATGERIKKLRKERNISVENIREYLQFSSTQAIYKWENGKCFPQADNLMALAKLFQVSPKEIMVQKDECKIQDIKEVILHYLCAKNETSKKRKVFEYTA